MIVRDKDIRHGIPIIKGTRISATDVLQGILWLVEDDSSVRDKIREYYKVSDEEIFESLNYYIEGGKEYCSNCGVEIDEENKALKNICNECKYGLNY